MHEVMQFCYINFTFTSQRSFFGMLIHLIVRRLRRRHAETKETFCQPKKIHSLLKVIGNGERKEARKYVEHMLSIRQQQTHAKRRSIW